MNKSAGARSTAESLIFWTSAGGSLALALVGLVWQQYWLGLALLPLFAAYLFVVKPTFYFWALLALLPLSVEFYIGSLGTDLPTEPIMLALSLYFIIHALCFWREYEGRFYAHPISLLVLLHVGWILFASAFSQGPLVSVKFALAKIWYVIPFFFLAGRLLRRSVDVRKMIWLIFLPLLFVAVQALLRHASYGFSFADQFRTMGPFMRNHVNYAGMLAAFVPWLVYLIWYKGWPRKLLLVALIWLVAVYFSYTRAAYVALILAGGAWWIIRRGWLRPMLVLGLFGMLAVSIYLLRNNTYLEYAPNYETTIAHERFDNLISATYKLEDISTMERAYRWVAAGHMVPYHPWTGWGPGNFIFFYEGHTVTSFTTYVSDNPERSGIHNYFLMTLVEQGFPGLIILFGLLLLPLAGGQSAYRRRHRWLREQLKTNGSVEKAADPRESEKVKKNQDHNAILMAALLSQIVIIAFLIINDMLETDKIGSLFWLNLAIMVNFSRPLADQRSTQPDGPHPTSQAEQ